MELSMTKKKRLTEKATLSDVFNGKKSKWLPLYHRLLARLSNVAGIEFFPFNKQIGIGHRNDSRPTLGEIRITAQGLEVGLGLSSKTQKTGSPRTENGESNSHPDPRIKPSTRAPRWITHRVLIAKASEIDEEFIGWVKAARRQARIARPRST